jgi:hypothetical protein
VPTTSTTLPNYAGDTLLANNAGADIDETISSVCNHSFFDSFYVSPALVIYNSRTSIPFLGNYLHGNPRGDTVIYIGGGIAERYDITPPNGSSVYIKGIASVLLNKYNSPPESGCNVSTGEVRGGPWRSDNKYTIGYQLLDTVEIFYEDIDTVGSYPNLVVAEVTKPLDSVRIVYNRDVGRCVTQVTSGPRGLLERFDHAYFDRPVEITDNPDCKKSFYAALRPLRTHRPCV